MDRIKMAVNRQQDFVLLPYRRAWDDQIDALKGLSALGPLAQSAVPAVAKLIQDGQASERAFFTLARIGPDSIPVLISLLNNSDRFTRYRAIGYLGNFKDCGEVIVPALVVCLNDNDIATVEAAASALAGFRQAARPAVPRLLQVAQESPHRRVVIDALAEIDCDGALNTLLGKLQSQNPQERARAASILGWFRARGRPAVPALLVGIKDQDELVRMECLLALRRIGETNALYRAEL